MFMVIYGMFTGWLRVVRNPGFPKTWDFYGILMGKYGMFMGKYGMFMGFPGISQLFSEGNGSGHKFHQKSLRTYSFAPESSFGPEEQI